MQQYSRQPGEEIVFGATLYGADTEIGTRAGYSGVSFSAGEKQYERIDWENGDLVRIFCPQASEPSEHYEDYFVTGVSADGQSSSASIDHNAGNIGLRWGTGDHYFYSMYPHKDKGLEGTGLSVNLNVGLATCILPSTQKYGSLVQEDGNWVAAPYKKYIYLAGYAQATAGGMSGPVEIKYNPAVTTFQITVVNDFDDSSVMTVASAGIKTADGYLTGIYDVNLDSSLGKDDIILTPSLSSIEMNFEDPENSSQKHIEISKGKSLTFTVFAQPGQDITKLTFWMKDKDGCLRESALKYRGATDKDWVTFPAFHKANITGLMAPKSSKWYIELGKSTNITLDSWVEVAATNVTQITLDQTRLELWCKETVTGTEENCKYSYKFFASEADAADDGNAIASTDIKINGSFSAQKPNDEPYPTLQNNSALGSVLQPSVVQGSASEQRKLRLTYNSSEIDNALVFGSDGKIREYVFVNHTLTNSYAQLDVIINKIQAQ